MSENKNEFSKRKTNPVYKLLLAASAIFTLIWIIMLLAGKRVEVGPFVILMFLSFALYTRCNAVLSRFAFTFWVFTFITTGMFYPWMFIQWGNFKLGTLTIPLIQVIMFGMGTKLSIFDFGRIIKMPKGIGVGMVLQFSIMPLAGFTLAKVFGFEAEVAAGIVLIGSSPCGVASNVINYLAGGNIPLAISITACSTLAAPFLTPALMQLLAGRMIEIQFVPMMWTIIKMIILPIAAGLITHHVLISKSPRFDRILPRLAIVLLIILVIGCIFWYNLSEDSNIHNVVEFLMILLVIPAAVGLVVGWLIKGRSELIDKGLPFISMFAICFILAIMVSLNRDKLIEIGILLVLASIIHNALGYILGYWGSRLMKLPERDCRTVAVEVGLQNGGMAMGLALNTLKSAAAALAPTIFGTWMNISGSILASYWHHKPIKPEPEETTSSTENQESTS